MVTYCEASTVNKIKTLIRNVPLGFLNTYTIYVLYNH